MPPKYILQNTSEHTTTSRDICRRDHRRLSKWFSTWKIDYRPNLHNQTNRGKSMGYNISLTSPDFRRLWTSVWLNRQESIIQNIGRIWNLSEIHPTGQSNINRHKMPNTDPERNFGPIHQRLRFSIGESY